MKKYKIALVTHYPKDPSIPRGGVESVSTILADSLSTLENLDVHVVTFNAKNSLTVKKYHGITIHQLPIMKGSALLTAIGQGRKIIHNYLLKLQPDIVHAHDTYGIMVKGLKLPRIFTIHGFIHADTLVSGSKLAIIRSLLWKYIETSSWAEQPNIISISPYVRERLRKIAKGRIFDIDNPIDRSFFEIKRRTVKGKIFCANVISPRKNIIVLVRAIHQVILSGIDCECFIAGHFIDPIYASKVHNEIQKLGLAKKIHLMGALNKSLIKKELAKANLFMLVSLEENSPLVIEEAMAAGLPIVTSNRCGMPYMVSHGENGFLVDPNNVQEIAAKVKMILRDTHLYQKMGKSSKEIATRRFHPELIAQKTMFIYNEILSTY